jgi:50S ribosomal protein L16 3-hydroxylase
LGQTGVFGFPGDMDASVFLAGHWQRRALFCPQALDAAAWTIEPEDLLSVAMEDAVSARLVTRNEQGFVLENGPFAEERLDDLPDSAWSVLVQAMEVWEPRYHGLIALFDFLPRWRIDDVMISLAARDGGVGPHVDQYDVFLIQVAGRRRWSFGGPVSRLVEGAPLRLLSRFEPEERIVAEPGDVLYLPPGVPHDGVALDDGCTTLSVGFRAPGLVDLADRLAEAAAARWQEEVEEEPRFTDPGRAPADDPWELPGADVVRARAILQDALDDPALVARLLGEQVTMPRLPPPPPEDTTDPDDLARRLAGGARLERWSGSRLAHHDLGSGDGMLFVDGEALPCSPELAAWLARRDSVTQDDLHECPDAREACSLLAELVNRGSFGIAR